jgi:hypothetical protein
VESFNRQSPEKFRPAQQYWAGVRLPARRAQEIFFLDLALLPLDGPTFRRQL